MEHDRDEESRLVPFAVAFLTTLLLMLGVLAAVVIVRTPNGEPAAMAETQLPPAVYLPREQDRLLMLFALAENESTPPDCYLLAGFLPDKGRIALCMLPPGTMVRGDGQWDKLSALFEQGGIAYAAKRLGGFLGIEIERSGWLDVSGLRCIMEQAGEFEYELTTRLDYPVHRRQVTLERGNISLDGRKLMDLLAYPAYPKGEKERSDRGVMLLTRILNAHLPDSNTEKGDELVKCFLNNSSSNISFLDYEQRKGAVRFLATLKLPAATAVYVDGSVDREDGFWLNEPCRARLCSVYGGDGFEPTMPAPGSASAYLGAEQQVEHPKEQSD